MVNTVQRGHIDDQASPVLRRVAIAAAQPARNHPTRAGRTYRRSDNFDIRGRKHIGAGPSSAPPSTQHPARRLIRQKFSHVDRR